MAHRLYINIKDWYDDAKENEISIQDQGDIAKCIIDGDSPHRIGQWLVALIHNEESPPEPLPSAKELLGEGAYHEVLLIIQSHKERVVYRSKSGEEREMLVRSLNHWGGRLLDDSDNEEAGYAAIGDSQYLDNAIRRLHSSGWGHVRNALKEIVISGGDVEEEWSTFKQMGDEFISEQTNGN